MNWGVSFFVFQRERLRMKWDLNSDEGLDAALCFFEEKHEPELALQLTEYFNQRLKDADVKSIHEPLFIRYFRIVMGRMCDDTDELHRPRKRMTPEQAFGFRLPRGKYEREDTESRDIRSAAYVVWALRQEHTTLVAFGEAANRFHSADNGDIAVKHAYAKYRESFEAFPSEVLEQLFA